MSKKKNDVFLICPVRGIHGNIQKAIEKYVKKIEDTGLVVHWPQRDTKQEDPSGGIRVCRDNIQAMINASEIHIWWNRESSGSKFDLGATMALAMVMKNKKVILANPDNIRKPTEGKSFDNVILQLQREDIWDIFDDLDEMYNKEISYEKFCEDLKT